ncbi:MAG: imidazole glycerol phosphate synthase subunit HisF [Terriglobales bacterium]
MAVDNLCKRIIPCLDVAGGRTVKGVQFQQLRDVGDPVELARMYEEQGADELMFLDITASAEERRTMAELVGKIAASLGVPFTVGGGIRSMDEVEVLLDRGADKVSVNSAALKNPQLLEQIANRYGSQCCVLAIDARRVKNGGGAVPIGHWEALAVGGRQPTGRDAFVWAKQAVELGAGEILLTSWDRDGTRDGFDLELTRCFAEGLPVPVIASGGAGGPHSFVDVFEQAHADAALAASTFHDGEWTVNALKKELSNSGVHVRLC